MPLTLSLRFLTGRAHLHPWQAHHSDGRVDWPPAPWRLLRALVATAGSGLTTLPEPLSPSIEDTRGDDVPPAVLGELLAALAAPPEIWVPRTSGGHTRQYLPIHESGSVRPSGSAVFDTFAVVSKDTPLHFHWPNVVLAGTQPEDLAKILRRLTYFGRAESWVEATAAMALPENLGVKPGETHWRCVCIEHAGHPPGRREHLDYTLERKLAAEGPLDTVLKEQAVELVPKCMFPGERRKGGERSTKFARLESQLRQTLSSESAGHLLLRCLLRASGEDMKDGLERPIGTRWVHYAVPRAIYELPPLPRVPRPRPSNPPVTLFRFALNTATVNRAVLPPLTDTLLFADKFRAAALAWHNHLESGEHPRNLCGREQEGNGERRIEGHDHAFFWPMDEDNDGFIDHVSVYCPAGFRASEADALRRLIRIRQRGGRPDLLVTPLFIGNADKFGPWQPEAKLFVSATPYFCPVNLTHGRRSGGKVRSIEAEIRRSLTLTGTGQAEADDTTIREIVFATSTQDAPATWTAAALPDPRYCTAWLKPPDQPFVPGSLAGLQLHAGTRLLRALSFCRRRRRHVIEGAGRMFQIEFPSARPGRPFSIGSQSHFGLGLFVPVTTTAVGP